MCRYGVVPTDIRASTRGSVTVGNKRPPNQSHFTNERGDEEFSQWIEPRTISATRGTTTAESWAVCCVEKWFEPPKRSGEIQPAAEYEATSSWFPSPPSPDFTLLGGIHGGAKGAAKMLCKLPGVGDCADDTETRGAVGVGDESLM